MWRQAWHSATLKICYLRFVSLFSAHVRSWLRDLVYFSARFCPTLQKWGFSQVVSRAPTTMSLLAPDQTPSSSDNKWQKQPRSGWRNKSPEASRTRKSWGASSRGRPSLTRSSELPKEVQMMPTYGGKSRELCHEPSVIPNQGKKKNENTRLFEELFPCAHCLRFIYSR